MRFQIRYPILIGRADKSGNLSIFLHLRRGRKTVSISESSIYRRNLKVEWQFELVTYPILQVILIVDRTGNLLTISYSFSTVVPTYENFVVFHRVFINNFIMEEETAK